MRPPLEDVNLFELEGRSFSCLEGCGFCCTFPPEVRPMEERRLRSKGVGLRVLFGSDRTHLALQGGCGACLFLRHRRCTVYEDRPFHCRTFPFHLYAGSRIEVYVNETCRGVVRSEGSLREAFFEALQEVPSDAWEEFHRTSTFARKVHKSSALEEIQGTLREIEEWEGDLFTTEGLSFLLRKGEAEMTVGELLQGALEPFEEPPERRPLFLLEDLRWIVGERRGESLRLYEMEETGRVRFEGEVSGLIHLPDDLRGEERGGLFREFEELLQRDLFVGATLWRALREKRIPPSRASFDLAAEVASDLLLRFRLARKLSPTLDPSREARKLYDSDFLDLPSVGGFL